ncbi:MAG: hypothetical protein LC798_13690 [Chloroflexi bacterium]|nr:hypothetical protein [Chloroflexota bacterium]
MATKATMDTGECVVEWYGLSSLRDVRGGQLVVELTRVRRIAGRGRDGMTEVPVAYFDNTSGGRAAALDAMRRGNGAAR